MCNVLMCDIFPEFYIDIDVMDHHFELSVWAIPPGSTSFFEIDDKLFTN